MQINSVVLLEEVQCEELEAFLVERIYEFNAKATGYFDARLLGARIQNETGDTIAGISGHTWGYCAEISNFWVSEHYRRQGLGTKLLRAVEAEAIRRGCMQLVLRTHSFQAPDFYARLGYLQECEIEDQPLGHSDIVLVKTFPESLGR
jgi:ribosomal protein S18 acetylase RimI-like enzyme